LNTDRWYYRVFQSAPDLIRALLPGSGVEPAGSQENLYRFAALELKELSHRLDGVLWPREGSDSTCTGSALVPVVLLEVQMQSDPGFQHRLAAQSYRFLQRHPQVEHLAVVVITRHGRQTLGPRQAPVLLRCFLEAVHWHNLEELSQCSDLDPLLNLLTLPVRPEAELRQNSRQILASRPDLDGVVLPMLMQRFPHLSSEEIMVIAGIPLDAIRHTRAAQEWLAEGEARGKAEEAARVTLRLLMRRCGVLEPELVARIEALPLEQLEALAEALLDFEGLADLEAWLAVGAA